MADRYLNPIVQEDLKRIMDALPSRKKLYNKTVLVTGANGMLASYMVHFFMYLNDTEDAGIKIYALSRNEEALRANFGFGTEKGSVKLLVQDVTEPIAIDGELDFVFHMAGMADPVSIMNDPVGVIKANVLGTMNVLELARKHGAEMVFTSTREVYGAMPYDPVKIREEDMGTLDNTDPRSCYPESKRLAEALLVSYNKEYMVNYTNVRIAHAYGPGMRLNNDGRVMADFISDAVSGRNIVMKSAGQALRSFIYVTDAVTGMLTALLNGGKSESYNLSNETEEISVRELAELITELAPLDLKVVFDNSQDASGYVKFKRVALDTTKLEGLGWKPEVGLKEGIRRTLEFYTC